MNYKNNKKLFSLISFCLLISSAQFSQAVIITLDSSAEYPAGSTSGGTFSAELLQSSCAKIGVLMFHGRGSTPTGPVVQEMRNSLHRAGYTTLSIANPIPPNGQTDFTSYVNDVGSGNTVFPEAYARMRSSINHLQSLGIEEVVVAGFSLGSRLATAHVARGQQDELPILGLIGVGMYGNSIDPLNISLTIDEVNLPVLDLYGSLDTNAVDTAVARKDAYNSNKSENKIYTENILSCTENINNSCHRLVGLKGDDSQPFEIAINAWMQSHAPAAVLADCTPTESSPTPDNSSGGSLALYFTIVLGIMLMLIRSFALNKPE